MLIAGLGVTAWSTPAAARASSAQRAQAKKLFEVGELHYQQGEFTKALTNYKKAHKTYRHPAFIFNIAQCHRQLKQYAKALFFYQLFLAEQPGAANKAEVKRRIREMKKELAALQLSQRQKGKLSIITSPAGASIYVNRVKGAPNATSPAILPVAAGQHLIMIKKSGYKMLTKAVDVTARKLTMLNLTLERDGSAVTPPPDRRVVTPPPDRRVVTPPPDRRVVTPPPDRRVVTPPPDPNRDEPKPTGTKPFYKQWWFWTGAGVAVAAVVVAGLAGSHALSMQDEWDRKLGAIENPSDFKSRARTFGAVADSMIGVGAAAAIGVTVGAILVSLKRKKERQATTSVLPSCGATGCGVWVTGRF